MSEIVRKRGLEDDENLSDEITPAKISKLEDASSNLYFIFFPLRYVIGLFKRPIHFHYVELFVTATHLILVIHDLR